MHGLYPLQGQNTEEEGFRVTCRTGPPSLSFSQSCTLDTLGVTGGKAWGEAL